MSLGENLIHKNRPISVETYVSDLKQIVQAFKTIDPSLKIILFGSVATNTATSFSDLDIAIVTQNSDHKKMVRKKIYSSPRVTECSVDYIFLTESQFENKIDIPIALAIETEGIELYPNWNFQHGP